MSKFLRSIFLFSLLVFAIDKLCYPLLYVFPNKEIDKRLEYVIEGELNKELIVIGSSRGARNIIASQIQDSLEISAYNLSYPGSNIEFHEFILHTYLKFNTAPKIVLLSIDENSEFKSVPSLNFRLERLYPLVKYNFINYELIKQGDSNLISMFLMLSRIKKVNLDFTKKKFSTLDTIKNCGSMPISFQRNSTNFVFDNSTKTYSELNESPEKIRAFNNLIELCLSNNIKLYLVFPPNFSSHSTSFENRIKKNKPDDVSIYVYDTTKSVYRDKSYYYDEVHLMTNGAVIFTNEIIDEIRNTDLLR